MMAQELADAVSGPLCMCCGYWAATNGGLCESCSPPLNETGHDAADLCALYIGETDTARIDVERLDDGTIEICIEGGESGADWTVTAAEARQIAAGIIAVVR